MYKNLDSEDIKISCKFFEIQGISMLIIDCNTRYILDVNNFFFKITNYKKSELLNKDILNFIEENDKPVILDNLFSNNNEINNVKIKFIAKKEILTLEFFINKDLDSKLIYIVCRNITEEKQMLETLESNLRELERLNHLMIGRELKMIELKKHINILKAKLEKYEL